MQAEAKRKGLTINRCDPGSHMLDGGRATYDPVDRLVIHEEVGTLFEQAFLVAHEIGHVVLGDYPEEVVVNTVDPARAAEAMPSGLDEGLADYGRRQRREVQMDLFARELLLPRSVARGLFVEDGMCASDMAKRLGAPFDMVEQQLLDALLLPQVVALPPGERVQRPLNDEQREAADHRGVPYLLEAGPGTGKTQTLAGRVEGLLGDGVDPRRILLLTFSNKAARAVNALIARGSTEERQTGDVGEVHRGLMSMSAGVFMTAAGAAAISIGDDDGSGTSNQAVAAPPVVTVAANGPTKAAAVIALLERPEGATLPELIEATGGCRTRRPRR